MLTKTFALLDAIRPDREAAPAACFDDGEIAELAALLRRLLWAPADLRQRLQQLGVNLTPSNFYSELPDLAAIDRSFAEGWKEPYDSIFDHRQMDEFLAQCLSPFAHEFAPPLRSPAAGAFAWENPAFSYSDPLAYYCFIRFARPRTIIEIGCGWSTLVADAACQANGGGNIICIEPSPPDFLPNLQSVTAIVSRPAQELQQEFFDQALNDNDILFIDSTHTVKHDSDCLHLYLKILPALKQSIFIHVHDVFLPRSLPQEWLRDQHIYWTEQYLLMAYLIDNPRTTVLYGSRYHYYRNLERLTAFMGGRYAPGGGSFWFSQQGRKSR